MNRKHRYILTVCAIAATLGGCQPDQKKEVAQYRQVLDKDAHPPTAAPAATQPLSVQMCLEMANASDEKLASAGEDYLQAIIAKNSAVAAFLPTLSLAPAYTVADNGNGGSASVTTLQTNASMNVFNGFRDVATLRQAGFTAEQRRQLLLDQQATLLLNVVQVYYSVLLNERQAQVYRTSIEYQQERVRDSEARVRLGIGKPLDLAQSKAELAASRVSLTQSETDARNARTTLAYLINMPTVSQPLVDDLSAPASVQQLGSFIDEASGHRSDLLAAIQATLGAEQGVKAAFGQYYPTVSLDLNYILYHDPSSGGLWTAGVNANIPIFEGGQIYNSVRTAWSQYRQAGLSEANLRRQITEEVTKAYDNLAASHKKLSDLDEQAAAARDALKLSEREYQLGSASNLDRLSSLNSLVNAELQRAEEQLNEKTFYVALLRSCGELQLSTLRKSAM